VRRSRVNPTLSERPCEEGSPETRSHDGKPAQQAIPPLPQLCKGGVLNREATTGKPDHLGAILPLQHHNQRVMEIFRAAKAHSKTWEKC